MARRVFPALDDEAIHAIGVLFGSSPEVEPYTPDGEPVYRIEPSGGAADGIRIIAWPSLQRVDVTRTREHAWVLKEVTTVEIIDGVEVVFRPSSFAGFLFVSVNGWVNMVVG